MSFYKEVPGRQTTLESTLKFDTKPTAGSTNPVTSDGVATAIAGAVGGASEALQEQIDDIAEKAGSGYTPKGPASVATLNGLTGQENGWLYTMTDAGTLTDGSLAVTAGDTVAWDEANSVWYKAMDYAPRQYGTNEVHNLPTTITSFRSGDVIPVDGPSGPAKMGKDDLLKETAENVLEGSVFNAFDPSKPNGDDGYAYHKGDVVAYLGKAYIFRSDKVSGVWDASKVAPVKVGFVASEILETTEISLTGISEPGNPGNIQRKDVFVPLGTAVTVTIPTPTWNTSNIGGAQGYCFTCGYVKNGVATDYKKYTSGNLASHAGEEIALPLGYTDYYVCMRGNTGEVATFFLTVATKAREFVEQIAQNTVSEGVITFTGAGDSAVVVQVPVYGECSVDYTIPNDWPSEGVFSSAYVCIGGQYNEVTSENNDNYRTAKNLISKNDMAAKLGTTISIDLSSTTKSFYLFLRAESGKTISIPYKIKQLNAVSTSNDRANVRELQLMSVEPAPDYTAEQYSEVDEIVRKTTLTSDALPSNLKKNYSNSIKLVPIVKNPGSNTWGQGMAISSDGFVLSFTYTTNVARIQVGSLFNTSIGYSKSVSTSGYITGTPHCNFAFWGTEKYDEADKYPLLYVGGLLGSTDLTEAANMLVLRIIGDLADGDNISFAVVQVVTFPSSIGQVGDVQVINGNLYAILGGKFTKFSALPQLSQGNVTFVDSDILDSFTIDVWTPDPIQCGCVVDGIYYSVHGSGSSGILAVMDVSNKTGSVFYMPVYGEYEAIFYFMDNFYVSNKITNLYGLAQALMISKVVFTFNEQ